MGAHENKPMPINFRKVTKSPQWDSLDKIERAFLMLYHAKDYANTSEIAKALDLGKRHTKETIKAFEEKCWVIKKENFLINSRMQAYPYYICTKEGKNEIARLLKKLDQGI